MPLVQLEHVRQMYVASRENRFTEAELSRRSDLSISVEYICQNIRIARTPDKNST